MKTISINGSLFLIPETMTVREVQQLAGALVTLTVIQSEYSYSDSGYMYYAADGAEVKIKDTDLVTKQEAQDRSSEGRKVYQAKQDAQKSID
jgi:hypothetical protein